MSIRCATLSTLSALLVRRCFYKVFFWFFWRLHFASKSVILAEKDSDWRLIGCFGNKKDECDKCQLRLMQKTPKQNGEGTTTFPRTWWLDDRSLALAQPRFDSWLPIKDNSIYAKCFKIGYLKAPWTCSVFVFWQINKFCFNICSFSRKVLVANKLFFSYSGTFITQE